MKNRNGRSTVSVAGSGKTKLEAAQNFGVNVTHELFVDDGINCVTFRRVKFEWDPSKAQANYRKHDVSFEEAADSFRDPLAVVDEDQRHPDRFVLIGESRSCRLILTIFAEKDGDTIRIISARKATPRERRQYEEADF